MMSTTGSNNVVLYNIDDEDLLERDIVGLFAEVRLFLKNKCLVASMLTHW